MSVEKAKARLDAAKAKVNRNKKLFDLKNEVSIENLTLDELKKVNNFLYKMSNDLNAIALWFVYLPLIIIGAIIGICILAFMFNI